jgi:hypothetical protein
MNRTLGIIIFKFKQATASKKNLRNNCNAFKKSLGELYLSFNMVLGGWPMDKN